MELENTNTMPDAAESSNADAAEGANEQETAAPDTADTGSKPSQTEQTAEENAGFAAARRRAEQEARRILEERDAMYAKRFGDRGIVHPVTKQPIRTEKDYFDALEAQERLQMEQEIQSGNVTPELLQRYVASSPVIQQARTMLEKIQMEEGQRLMRQQIAEISKMDPDIRELSDVVRLPTFPEFDRLVRSGVDMVSAYKAANFERLSNRSSAAAKQAAINAAKGKNHLTPVEGQPAADDGLTDEIIAQYRAMNPKWTREQIQKFHRNYQKGV